MCEVVNLDCCTCVAAITDVAFSKIILDTCFVVIVMLELLYYLLNDWCAFYCNVYKFFCTFYP